VVFSLQFYLSMSAPRFAERSMNDGFRPGSAPVRDGAFVPAQPQEDWDEQELVESRRTGGCGVARRGIGARASE
jgi:hypothetical protein